MKTKPLAFALSTIFLLGAMNFVLTQSQQRSAHQSYQNGRALEARGRTEDARIAYNEAIAICRNNIASNPRNMDAYLVYCWSLVRLNRWQEAVEIGRSALSISEDPRVMQAMGEAYFYLNNYADSLRSMERYADALPSGDRAGTAYFFMAEIYRLTGRYNLAEFAYTVAVHYEPGLPLWWYRLGTVREETGYNAGAAEAYQRAAHLQPGFRDTTERLRNVQSGRRR